MNSRPMPTEDRLETHRALMKLLEYVEDECARMGFSASTWMVAMSRNTLESELRDPPTLHFDESGHPRLN
ncbi:MAG: hypothetical protein ACLFWF_11130 [Alphaproteobacteria bacterium]